MGEFMTAWQNEAAGLEGYGGMPEDMEVQITALAFRERAGWI